MSKYNIIDQLLGMDIMNRGSFFMNLAEAERFQHTVMKDNGWHTNNPQDARQTRDHFRPFKKFPGIGSAADIALLAPALEASFCKYLAGMPVREEFDPDERDPTDNNNDLGILSNSTPTKSQLTGVRRLAQQALGLLRAVITERQNRNTPIQTVGLKAKEALRRTYTGDERYDKQLRSELR